MVVSKGRLASRRQLLRGNKVYLPPGPLSQRPGAARACAGVARRSNWCSAAPVSRPSSSYPLPHRGLFSPRVAMGRAQRPRNKMHTSPSSPFSSLFTFALSGGFSIRATRGFRLGRHFACGSPPRSPHPRTGKTFTAGASSAGRHRRVSAPRVS